MRILLTEHYSHASGVRLTPGEYDAADPRIGGLAAYLVQTEQATLISANETDAEVGERPDGSESGEQVSGFAEVSYDGYTVAELKAIAKERGVNLSGATKKDDIIAVLEEHDVPEFTTVDNSPLDPEESAANPSEEINE